MSTPIAPGQSCKRGHDPAEYGRDSRGHRVCAACRREVYNVKHRIGKRQELPMPRAATRPRQKKRYSNAKLTRRQVHAAWKYYETGVSTAELAARGWEEWGYLSYDAARVALQRAFSLEGFQVRDRAFRRQLAFRARGCTGCGCDLDDRTFACRACNHRHWQRQHPGRRGQKALKAA